MRQDETVDEVLRLRRVEAAAVALLDDVRRRYPGEELRCPYMRELDAAVTSTERQP